MLYLYQDKGKQKTHKRKAVDFMTKLIRDKKTGDYYTLDKKYHIEKGTTGWNVNELDERNIYKYSFSCDTLKEVKESL